MEFCIITYNLYHLLLFEDSLAQISIMYENSNQFWSNKRHINVTQFLLSCLLIMYVCISNVDKKHQFWVSCGQGKYRTITIAQNFRTIYFIGCMKISLLELAFDYLDCSLKELFANITWLLGTLSNITYHFNKYVSNEII